MFKETHPFTVGTGAGGTSDFGAGFTTGFGAAGFTGSTIAGEAGSEVFTFFQILNAISESRVSAIIPAVATTRSFRTSGVKNGAPAGTDLPPRIGTGSAS